MPIPLRLPADSTLDWAVSGKAVAVCAAEGRLNRGFHGEPVHGNKTAIEDRKRGDVGRNTLGFRSNGAFISYQLFERKIPQAT